jgi:hypothetical protein
LWQESPKVSERRELVLRTAHGAALFDAPRAEWMEPVADWGRRGEVSIGRFRVSAVEVPLHLPGRLDGRGD